MNALKRFFKRLGKPIYNLEVIIQQVPENKYVNFKKMKSIVDELFSKQLSITSKGYVIDRVKKKSLEEAKAHLHPDEPSNYGAILEFNNYYKIQQELLPPKKKTNYHKGLHVHLRPEGGIWTFYINPRKKLLRIREVYESSLSNEKYLKFRKKVLESNLVPYHFPFHEPCTNCLHD